MSSSEGISAGEIVVIVTLFAALAIAIWWFYISYKYRQTLNVSSYTKGANLDTGTFGQGNSGVGVVSLSCEEDREICVWKATAICTGALSPNSNTENGPEPISGGGSTPYGDFDPMNTVDLTADMSKLNGQQQGFYTFNNENYLRFNGNKCPLTYDQSTGSGTRPQLIATYTCIPSGTTCVSSKGKKKTA